MTDLQDALDRIKDRAEKATEGPWGYYTPRGQGQDPIFGATPGDEVALVKRPTDWHFITAARTDVPRLVEAIEAVLELLKEPEEWHIYDTRDMGEAYDADTVKDFIGDVREALADKLTGEDDE